MIASPTPCPKCQGLMQEGFIVPRLPPVQNWVSGKPEFSLWTGFKLKGREQHSVQTFRCRDCGYLESYAKGEG